MLIVYLSSGLHHHKSIEKQHRGLIFVRVIDTPPQLTKIKQKEQRIKCRPRYKAEYPQT